METIIEWTTETPTCDKRKIRITREHGIVYMELLDGMGSLIDICKITPQMKESLAIGIVLP
ncbi:MAG TPA: hypothetical protein VII99_11350 [Bacteroidia bacterium]